MTSSKAVDVTHVAGDGVTLHVEIRGSGPAVLLIPGAGGDASHLAGVSSALADEFTAITYDRRGNSRSTRTESRTTTSLAEQADDAAAVLRGAGQTPGLVFGTSLGAVIALELAAIRPEVVTGVVVHEPPVPTATPDPEAVMSGLGALVEQGISSGGPCAAMELFMRWAAGDEVFEGIASAERERSLGNAETFFGAEMPALNGFAPTADALLRIKPHVLVAASSANGDPDHPAHWLHLAASWFAEHLATDLHELPGGHGAYFHAPNDYAEALRPLLHQLGQG